MSVMPSVVAVTISAEVSVSSSQVASSCMQTGNDAMRLKYTSGSVLVTPPVPLPPVPPVPLPPVAAAPPPPD